MPLGAFHCQAPILAKSKRLGVDFVFAPSQESQSQSQESQPHQNPVVPGKVEDWNSEWKII